MTKFGCTQKTSEIQLTMCKYLLTYAIVIHKKLYLKM